MPEYASWPRRIVALIIDWAASTFVTVGIIGLGDYLDDPNSGWFVLGIFALEVTLSGSRRKDLQDNVARCL